MIFAPSTRSLRQIAAIGDAAVSQTVVDTPIGALVVEASSAGVTRVQFTDGAASDVKLGKRAGAPASSDADAVLRDVAVQLQSYFTGDLALFDVPLDPAGTAFQLAVWRALVKVPAGETVSYAALAAQAGSPKAARAVGLAMGANPIPVIVPCHRVVRSDGSMGGFGGGLWRKRWLLEHEVSLDAPALQAVCA